MSSDLSVFDERRDLEARRNGQDNADVVESAEMECVARA